MTGRIDARLEEMGIELPEALEPKVAKIKGSNIAALFIRLGPGATVEW